MARSDPVTRASSLTSTEFSQRFGRSGRPVVLTDVVRSWPCFERWTLPYLASAIGEKRFAITLSQDGAFPVLSSRVEAPDVAEILALKDFFQVAAGDRPNGVIRYLQQKSIERCLPELTQDLGHVNVAGTAELRDVNFWCGQRGSRIPLHYDTFDNFLAQIRGAKRVRLFPPSDTPLLYPGREGTSFASEVDPDDFDSARYPLFSQAHPLADIMLDEGEVLFIPAFWWHYVVTESCYAISLNYWYHSVWGHPRAAFMRARELLDLGRATVAALPKAQRELALSYARGILED